MCPIDTVSNILAKEFEESYLKLKKPVLITDSISSWQALKKWSFEYLSIKLAQKKIDLFNTENLNSETRSLDINDFLTSISGNNTREYCAQMEASSFLYELSSDFSRPPFFPNNRQYNPIIQFKSEDNLIDLRWESDHLFVTQVQGSGSVSLINPKQSNLLYPTYDSPLYNRSSIIDIENPDYVLYPNCKGALIDKVTLNPGNILFIPSGWWHQFNTLSSSLSLTFSCKPKLAECEVLHILRHKLKRDFSDNKFYNITTWLNLDQFHTYLEVAEYLVQRNCLWGAVYFCSMYLQKKLVGMEEDMTEENSCNSELENYLCNLTYLAASENDYHLYNFNIAEMIASLNSKFPHQKVSPK